MLINDDHHGRGYDVMSPVDGVVDFLSSITVGLLWNYLSPAIGFAFAGVLAIISGFLMLLLKFKNNNQ